MSKFDELYAAGIIDPNSEKCLYICDMEFFPKEKYEYYINDIYEDMQNVIPFAKNSGGDVYAWLVEDGKQTDIVAFCSHDDGESVIYAEDICAAVFRRILESCCEEELSEDEDDEDDEKSDEDDF